MVESEYSVKDVARIFGLQEARLRYWAQTGFIGPSLRRRGRFYYTFQDLIGVRLAKELLDKGLTLQRVRRNLDALRSALPSVQSPLSRVKVCSDGDHLVVVDEDVVYEPASGQVVMDFAVASLSTQLADVAPISSRADVATDQTAYQWFLDGCRAEADGDDAAARADYERALGKDPAIAAAHTNLGNVLYRAGERGAARRSYERALELDPEQPEARFNLGNVLDDLGETDLAIAELRHVSNGCPEFADAHFNLGVILARVGGVAQARALFERYLALDPDSDWAAQARGLLTELDG
jgi:tetratricopeptide (TPR) repeat protein